MAERTNYKNPPISSDENGCDAWRNKISMWQLMKRFRPEETGISCDTLPQWELEKLDLKLRLKNLILLMV